jgi:hypothetical protein
MNGQRTMLCVTVVDDGEELRAKGDRWYVWYSSRARHMNGRARIRMGPIIQLLRLIIVPVRIFAYLID